MMVESGDRLIGTIESTVKPPRSTGSDEQPPAPPPNPNNNVAPNDNVANFVNKMKSRASTISNSEQFKHASQQAKHLTSSIGSFIDQTIENASKPKYVHNPDKIDRQALRDLDLCYVTSRIITVSHPTKSPFLPDPPQTSNPHHHLHSLANLLNSKHHQQYMVWNVSEVAYDYSPFGNMVMEFNFPGHPAPPLGVLVKVCTSVENWLESDPQNVAVIHCLTGQGRTAAIVSSILSWCPGNPSFPSPLDALLYMSNVKKMHINELTIPSQRRYLRYFSNILEGVKPCTRPVLLKRVLMSKAPNIGRNETGEDGCAPYLQIFKGGKLVLTTSASEGKWVSTSDGQIIFPVGVVIQGDILVRCRHVVPLSKSKRVSLFRGAFHTGYIPDGGLLRLSKDQLDGACEDDRFADDFTTDLIFGEVDAEVAGQHLSEDPQGDAQGDLSEGKELNTRDTSNSAEERRSSGLLKTQTQTNVKTVSATIYDSMLSADGTFWNSIAERRRNKTQSTASKRNILGKRRDLTKIANNNESDEKAEKTAQKQQQVPAPTKDAFSISNAQPPPPSSSTTKSEVADDLMAALAIDDSLLLDSDEDEGINGIDVNDDLGNEDDDDDDDDLDAITDFFAKQP